ncbi:TatD family hydrolase, partial [Verrucomicrobiales bacterium]|nr:TatD family hydrolase [Verrucomicrobiales bacterium]
MLVDTHCHLAFPDFADEMEAVIDRARQNDVTRIIAIGTGLDDSRTNIALAERFPGTVFAAVGIHPCNVSDVTSPDWQEQLTDMAAHPSVVAIGETGTDHFHAAPEGFTEKEYHALQDEFLAKHLEIASATGKNLVIHQRESYAHTIAQLAPL